MAVVMVVDDDPQMCSTLKGFLTRRGHRINCAANGKEAMEIMTADVPDVVILDAMMPLVDGVQFLEVMRCYLRWQHTPVIMVTGHAEGPHIQRVGELGVRKTFLKGDFELDELATYIEAMGPGGLSPESVPLPYHSH